MKLSPEQWLKVKQLADASSLDSIDVVFAMLDDTCPRLVWREIVSVVLKATHNGRPQSTAPVDILKAIETKFKS